MQPPDLTYASGVVALDGTPTQRLWELSLGERLNHRPVLSDAERREYIRDGLNLNLVRTSEYVKPYNSSDHVAAEQDAALLEAVHEQHDEKGSDLSYGAFGDDVLRHMRENETLQAAMRFGRDGNGAVVYVHTDTLPDWVPLAAEGRVRRTWSDGMREVLTAAERRSEWTTAEIASAVDLSTRQVRDHLHRLVDDGVVSCEYDGSGYVWHDDGLHRVNDNGAVELEPVDDDELGADESAEVARNSVYSWDFRGHAGSGVEETAPATTASEDTATTRPNGGTAAANPPD